MKTTSSLRFAVLALACLVACGGETVDGTPPPASADADRSGTGSGAGTEASGRDQVGASTSADLTCTAPDTATPSCAPPLDVSTAEAVENAINGLTELTLSSTTASSGVALRPTRDLHATKAIELDIERLRTESRCPSSANSCDESWSFSGEKSAGWTFPMFGGTPALALPDGVTCIDASCSRLAIAAGTVVRFQRAFEPFAFGGKYPHYVRVVRACTASCGSDELRCAASNTCISERAFCTLCDGGSATVCACRNGCATQPDGTKCSYNTSDDTTGAGTCSAGSCK